MTVTLLQVINNTDIINATLISKYIGISDELYQQLINETIEQYRVVYPNYEIKTTLKEYQFDGYPVAKPKLNSCQARMIVKLNDNETLAIYIQDIESAKTLIYQLDADIHIASPYLLKVKQELSNHVNMDRLNSLSDWTNDLSIEELVNGKWQTKYQFTNDVLEQINLPSVRPTYQFTPK